MGVAEDAFERLRRIAFEGEHMERMAALGARTKLSPGVIKILVRLARHDGVSMGDMARGIGVDPSYITALVDDLDERGLARREPAPYDRRVKIIVLTDDGRKLAEEIDDVLSVPPAGFAALSAPEMRQLRDLLEKVLAAREAESAAKDAVASACRNPGSGACTFLSGGPATSSPTPAASGMSLDRSPLRGSHLRRLRAPSAACVVS